MPYFSIGSRDHPRIRGEHRILPPGQTLPGGSSPHTRGAPAPSGLPRGFWRIIPAYAGSTSRRRRATRHDLDHPRIRGEHMMPDATMAAICGSSPHTRGALLLIYSIYICIVDHPRIRGEHVKLPPIHLRSGGSSPHTRGAQPRRGRLGAGPGIIPAYAGSTRSRRSGS